MNRKTQSRLTKALATVGRYGLALAGGALFGWLAWNPQPPPPVPGESVPTPDKSKATPTNRMRPVTDASDKIEQVGSALFSKPGADANIHREWDDAMESRRLAHCDWKDHRHAIAVAMMRDRMVGDESATRAMVNAPSRGPPGLHPAQGREAPFHFSFPLELSC